MLMIIISTGILATAFIFCLWAGISESWPEKDKTKKGFILLSFIIVIWLSLLSVLTIKVKETENKDQSRAPAEATAQQLITSEFELRQYVLRCSETSNGICITYDIYKIVKE